MTNDYAHVTLTVYAMNFQRSMLLTLLQNTNYIEVQQFSWRLILLRHCFVSKTPF